jgi:hypothetical protein
MFHTLHFIVFVILLYPVVLILAKIRVIIEMIELLKLLQRIMREWIKKLPNKREMKHYTDIQLKFLPSIDEVVTMGYISKLLP